MKKILMASLGLIILAGVVACGPTRPKGIKDCEFRLADVKTGETALTYVKLGIEMDVTNPNPVEVIIDHMRFKIYANGVEVGSGAKNFGELIEPGDSKKLRATVSIDYVSAGAALFSIIKSNTASYNIKAKVYYETPLGAYSSSSSISKASVGF